MADGSSDMCEACPPEATCAELGTTLKTLVVNTANWRPGHQSTTIKLCPHNDTCANGTTPDAVYNRFDDATCAPGRGLAGAYCQLCLNATQYFSQGHCHACNAARAAASIVIPVVLVAAIALALWRCQAQWNGAIFRRIAARSTVKIAIGFYQIVSQLTAVYSITYYPPEYERIVSAFRIVNLHVFAWLPDLQPACLDMPTLLDQLLFATFAPIAVALAVVAIVKLRGAPLASALPFVLYWSFLIYPSVSSRGFRALAPCDCFEYVGANVSRTCFLRTDYEEQCTFGSRPWPEPPIMVAAWLAIILYGIAVPLLYAWLLTRKSMAQSEALNFLTKDYESHARGWELVEVVKKLTFTGFLALVDPGTLTQMYLAVTCSITILVLQLLVVPYRRRMDNMLATLSEVALAFTLLGTLGLDMSQYSPSPLVESSTIVAMLIVAALVVIIVAVGMLLLQIYTAHWQESEGTHPAPPLNVDPIESSKLQPNSPGVTTEEANRLQRTLQSLMNKPWRKWFPRVAVSYATGHREGVDAAGAGPGMMRAAAVMHALHNNGIPCANGLCVPAGVNWKEFLTKINSDNAQCEVLIVLLSRAFYGSSPCLKEVDAAMQRGLEIYPLRCEEDLPKREEQWAGIAEKDSEVSAHMVKRVQQMLSKLNALPPRGFFFDSDEYLDKLTDDINLMIGEANAASVLTESPATTNAPAENNASSSPGAESSMGEERQTMAWVSNIQVWIGGVRRRTNALLVGWRRPRQVHVDCDDDTPRLLKMHGMESSAKV